MEVKQLKGIAESYNQVYYNHDNFISDLSEICLENFFETYEDSDYFVQQLVEQNLLEEFLFDLSEELDANISCYLQEGYLTEVSGAALRGIVNALGAAARGRAGLSAATALGKTGNIIKGSAASTAIRSARQAARATQPATQLPGKYLTALQTKRAARGLPPAGGTTASTPKAVAQRAASAGWQRDAAAKNLAQQAVDQAKTVAAGFMKALRQSNARDKLATAAAGTRGTGVRIGQPGAPSTPSIPSIKQDAEQLRLLKRDNATEYDFTKNIGNKGISADPIPQPQGPRSSLPKPPEKPSPSSPGQLELNLSRSSTPSSRRSTGYTPPDAGLPFRATGPGGDARIQRLASQAASTSGGPTKPKNNALKAGAAIAGIGALTVGATGAALNQKKEGHDPTNHYNTMDPNGRIRDRLAVGPKIVGPKIVGPKIVGTGSVAGDFDAAFKKARTSGKKEFDFGGKKYTTQLASEGNEKLEVLADKLVIEGYVKDYDGAISMINSLDENGLSTLAQRIFEA